MEKLKKAWENSKQFILGETPTGEKKVYFVLNKAEKDHYDRVFWYRDQKILGSLIHEDLKNWRKGKSKPSLHTEKEFKKIIRWLFS